MSDSPQYTPVPPQPQGTPAPAQSGLSDNAAGAIAYITFIPAIIFLILEPYNKSSFVRFHSWQSIFLACAAVLINFVLGIFLAATFLFAPFLHLALSRLVELFWLVVWVLCLVNAWQGKRFKLPLIGALAEQQANR